MEFQIEGKGTMGNTLPRGLIGDHVHMNHKRNSAEFEHIIIGGLGRSGTSLLEAMLGSHSKIGFYVLELPYWTGFNLVYKGKLFSLEKAIDVLDEILGHFTVKIADVTFEREYLVGKLQKLKSNITIEDIYIIFLEYYRAKREKQIIGLKTPLNEFYVADIFKSFPKTKFLHMIRNPMDQAVSFKVAQEKWWGGKANNFLNIYMWESSVDAARENEEKYKGHYMVLTYEELVSNPDDTLQRICEFLTVDYEHEMITGYAHPRWKGSNSSFKGGTKQGVTTKSVGRYKTLLSKNDQWKYMQLVGSKLVAFNYLSIEELPAKRSALLEMRYSTARFVYKLRFKLSNSLKNTIFFKSIRGVKRALGLSHANFLEKLKS